MSKIKRIGVIANLGKPPAVEVAREAIAYLDGRLPIFLPQKTFAERLGRPELYTEGGDLNEHDVVVVFGGDGTMLASSLRCAQSGTPLLGVNVGRFGFLTEALPEMLVPALDHLMAGDFSTEERLTLACEIVRGGEIVVHEHALNEVVIAHGALARVLHLITNINGKYLTTYAADGIIVATPTGSTAYSLSAGGPLVHPEVRAMLIQPICAHTLMTRTLLVPVDHEVEIVVQHTDGDYGQVTLDGQRGVPLGLDDRVRIKKGRHPVKLVTNVGGATFYDKLHTKLRWGEQIAL